MFDFLCYQPSDSYLPKPGPVSFIRIINASPLSRRVDVYSNGHLIGKNIGYKKYTSYFTVPSGMHNISIYPAGKKMNLITYKNIDLESNSIYTLAITEGPSPGLLLVQDHDVNKKEGYANIRFINLFYSPNPIDVNLTGQPPLFTDVEFQGMTNYLPLPSEKYSLQFKLKGSDKLPVTVPGIILKEQWNYTIYAMGLTDKKPGLQIVTLLDGNTYLQHHLGN